MYYASSYRSEIGKYEQQTTDACVFEDGERFVRIFKQKKLHVVSQIHSVTFALWVFSSGE